MPSASKRFCRHTRCSALVEQGTSYCAKHKTLYVRAENLRRGTSSQRGYGANWRKLRLIILRRNPVCQWPGCTQAATDVDHILPRAKGGTDDISNLQALCHEHHSTKTASEDGGFGNKVRG